MRRLYVHAGVEPGVPLELQSETTLLWSAIEGSRTAWRTHIVRPDMIDGRYCTGAAPIWTRRPGEPDG